MARNFAGGTDRLLFGGANGYTTGCVAFWMKMISATANMHVLSAWSGSSRTGLGFIMNNTANKLLTQAYDATTARVNLVSATTMNNGAWHHVAYNFNTANGSAQTVYVDGAVDVSGTASAAWSMASTAIAFGDPLDAFWATYNGDLAEMGFWSRNLTADEIAALAKGFAPQCVARSALDFHCPLVRDQFNRRDPFISSTVGTTVSDHPRSIGSLT